MSDRLRSECEESRRNVNVQTSQTMNGTANRVKKPKITRRLLAAENSSGAKMPYPMPMINSDRDRRAVNCSVDLNIFFRVLWLGCFPVICQNSQHLHAGSLGMLSFVANALPKIKCGICHDVLIKRVKNI